MHSIFKIGIARNMKCAYMVGFLKYSHIIAMQMPNAHEMWGMPPEKFEKLML